MHVRAKTHIRGQNHQTPHDTVLSPDNIIVILYIFNTLSTAYSDYVL